MFWVSSALKLLSVLVARAEKLRVEVNTMFQADKD